MGVGGCVLVCAGVHRYAQVCTVSARVCAGAQVCMGMHG